MFNLDFSVHAFLGGPHRLPLYDWQTRTISKLEILRKQRHLHLGCPWGKLKNTKN